MATNTLESNQAPVNQGKLTLFPLREPFARGQLSVSDLHSLYYEVSGHNTGQPVVLLHGGPGGSSEPKHRQYFDPEIYRVILFDQRGCGKSTPRGELLENTTQELVSDMEKLREFLQIEKWMVVGASWGSTLALNYALEHPERVTGLILRSVFLASKAEDDWFYRHGANQIFPDEWRALVENVPPTERANPVAFYLNHFLSPAASIALHAKLWMRWEEVNMRIEPSEPKPGLPDANFLAWALPSLRIQAHYLKHQYFFPAADFLIEKAMKAAGEWPTIIVHGRFDFCCPVASAWRLHQALPQSELRLIERASHSASEKRLGAAYLRAIRDIAAKLAPI